MAEDARIVINTDGTWEDANDAALTLLGVDSVEQLKSLPPGAFSMTPPNPGDSEAFRAAWTAQGSAPIVGETTMRRTDGQEIPIKFLIGRQEDGRFLAVVRPVAQSPGQPVAVVSAGQALSAWRAAERRLEALRPNSPEWSAAKDQVDEFREQYRRLFVIALARGRET